MKKRDKKARPQGIRAVIQHIEQASEQLQRAEDCVRELKNAKQTHSEFQMLERLERWLYNLREPYRRAPDDYWKFDTAAKDKE